MKIGRTLVFTRSLVVTTLLIWLGGCASPSQPSRFYRLESATPPLSMPQVDQPGQRLPILGIGPVQLASYLDRPQMVERRTPYRLTLHEFDRWAGTLQENVVQVLSDVVQQQLGRVQVIGYPWHSSVRPDYELAVTIDRFERQGSRVRLEARWTVLAQPEGRVVRLGRQPFETPLGGSDMEAVAAAASNALEQLGQVLADEMAPLLNLQDRSASGVAPQTMETKPALGSSLTARRQGR